MCERRIARRKNTPRSYSSFDINCGAEKMYQMMNLNGPNTIKPEAHKNPILKSYFRVFLDSFKRNERQGGGKRTFNVTFAAPYKESVRRTILGIKSEFKS